MIVTDPWGCDGRVVKASDSKSDGIFPHRFEPCSQRVILIAFSSHIAFFLNCLVIFAVFVNKIWKTKCKIVFTYGV